MHGGSTPKGKDSPHFKTGRYSKYLPKQLAERYQEASKDPELMSLRDEIALIDARLSELVQAKDWEEIYECIERRRMLVESERKRLIEMQQTITAERAYLLITSLVDIVREHVDDKRAMAAIAEDARRLVSDF